MVKPARQFWYNNKPGEFKDITRQQIHVHGGPASDIACSTCRVMEWTSRARQENLFVSHGCGNDGEVRFRCARQGDELWTTYHQDFWGLMMGCDPDLNAARCLVLFHPHKKVRLNKRFRTRYCDFLFMNFRRLLAHSCQVDLAASHKRVDWSKYDFVIYQNLADGYAFPKPPIPMVMIMYDLWLRDYQGIIDHFRPEYLLTPYPKAVKDNFRFNGKVHFYPLHDSTFFARPNLGKKKLDLIVAGSNRGKMYRLRRELDKQVKKLKGFHVEYSHHHGARRHHHTGPVAHGNERYLNKWSEYLGMAKYAAFAGFEHPRWKPVLFAKYYELLGSGAIPIMPTVQDLHTLLGVKPMVHYIPLKRIWGRNGFLRDLITHYPTYHPIAENAVAWHRENEQRLLFDQFEDLVQDVTGGRYPRRLY